MLNGSFIYCLLFSLTYDNKMEDNQRIEMYF